MLRHSSRRQRLDSTVLAQRLAGAVAYDRIAGYFRSSLFAYFSPSRTAFQADRGRHFSVIADGVSD